ncbi:hypothetical protein SPRG_17758, partial [Saprolegnia parasitica CBS 223.65]
TSDGERITITKIVVHLKQLNADTMAHDFVILERSKVSPVEIAFKDDALGAMQGNK